MGLPLHRSFSIHVNSPCACVLVDVHCLIVDWHIVVVAMVKRSARYPQQRRSRFSMSKIRLEYMVRHFGFAAAFHLRACTSIGWSLAIKSGFRLALWQKVCAVSSILTSVSSLVSQNYSCTCFRCHHAFDTRMLAPLPNLVCV